MYFPDDMTFQYFFFDTYPGDFLQALPVALIAGAVYIFLRRRSHPQEPLKKQFLSSLFVCYLTGLLCLTLFERFLGGFYYFLFYRQPSGMTYHWFTMVYDLIPDFHLRFTAENLGNILMYLPFGILYPLFRPQTSWKHTLCAGMGTSLVIELIQPVFGRAFDVNDIILNALGTLLSTAIFFCCKGLLSRSK